MPDFDRYYQDYAPLSAIASFARRGVSARNNAARLSWFNRLRDYARMSGDPVVLALHRKLNALLETANADWNDHDYGQGYFYQGFEALGISGLRSTEKRIQAFDLDTLVAGKSVLDIGCNAGFVSLALAPKAKSVIGLDVNSHLIEIARTAADHLECPNARFVATAFEDVKFDHTFDVVLSLANHSTFDGKTQFSLDAYFDRCRSLIKPGGFLAFESHPKSYEGEGLAMAIDLIEQRFKILRNETKQYGAFLDRDRCFVLAERFD